MRGRLQHVDRERQRVARERQLVHRRGLVRRRLARVDRVDQRVDAQDDRLATHDAEVAVRVHRATLGRRPPRVLGLSVRALVGPDALDAGLDEVLPRHRLQVRRGRDVDAVACRAARVRLGRVLVGQPAERVPQLVEHGLDVPAADHRHAAAAGAQRALLHEHDRLAVVLGQLVQHALYERVVDDHVAGVGHHQARVERGVVLLAEAVHARVGADQVRAQEVEVGVVLAEGALPLEVLGDARGELVELLLLLELVPVPHQHEEAEGHGAGIGTHVEDC